MKTARTRTANGLNDAIRMTDLIDLLWEAQS